MQRTLFGHPIAIAVLFFAEMWERFSYYGMRALLVLYMTDSFLFTDNRAYAIYGSYTALVYLTPIFGGILADRLLGYRKAVIIGALFMAAGHFCMAIEQLPVFYLALALLIIGNGFFKPNMSTVVGKLYAEGDPRRDAGFTIFYMGVNLGAALAPIVCGWVGGRYGWHWGFTLAGIGMLLGLVTFVLGQRTFEGHGEPPDPQRLNRPLVARLINAEHLTWIGAFVAVALCWQLIQWTSFVGWVLTAIGIVVLVFWIGFSLARCEAVGRHRVWVALGLMAFSMVFWAFFEQAGSSMNLFTLRNVDTVVLGTEVPAPVMQSINPIFIILFGPVFASLWVLLDRVGLNPSIPMKFGLGITQLGLGFVALWYGAFISQGDGIVGLSWLALGYMLHTTGELCLSPVGLSMVTKLSPPKMTGMMMGTWYLSFAFATYVAGLIAQLTGIGGEDGGSAEQTAVDTVMVYGGVFGQIALVALGTGLFVMLVSPLINRGTHGVR